MDLIGVESIEWSIDLFLSIVSQSKRYETPHRSHSLSLEELSHPSEGIHYSLPWAGTVSIGRALFADFCEYWEGARDDGGVSPPFPPFPLPAHCRFDRITSTSHLHSSPSLTMRRFLLWVGGDESGKSGEKRGGKDGRTIPTLAVHLHRTLRRDHGTWSVFILIWTIYACSH